MTQFNSVTLVGRLTADPALRYTNSGKAVANFSLAVDRDYTDAQGNREVDFIDIVVWGKLAEVVAQYKQKGDLVLANGRLQVRPWEDNEGNRRRSTEVVAETIRFLSFREQEPTTDDPFADEPAEAPEPEPQKPAGRKPAGNRRRG